MNDTPMTVLCTLIAVLFAALLFAAGFDANKSVIKQDCERNGAFYIDDQRYNCEVEK